ncbi:hypothetical protein SALBM217S_07666 [Streptomyces griseoloalbus]
MDRAAVRENTVTAADSLNSKSNQFRVADCVQNRTVAE